MGGKRIAFHGPVRVSKDEAEADRRVVAASISQALPTSRPGAASRALQGLLDRQGGDVALCDEEPGSASFASVPDPLILKDMNHKELRNLASRTVGVQKNKKNSKGNWVSKGAREIMTELLAIGASTSTQALPGVVKKRPSSR